MDVTTEDIARLRDLLADGDRHLATHLSFVLERVGPLLDEVERLRRAEQDPREWRVRYCGGGVFVVERRQPAMAPATEAWLQIAVVETNREQSSNMNDRLRVERAEAALATRVELACSLGCPSHFPAGFTGPKHTAECIAAHKVLGKEPSP